MSQELSPQEGHAAPGNELTGRHARCEDPEVFGHSPVLNREAERVDDLVAEDERMQPLFQRPVGWIVEGKAIIQVGVPIPASVQIRFDDGVNCRWHQEAKADGHVVRGMGVAIGSADGGKRVIPRSASSHPLLAGIGPQRVLSR